MVKSTVAMPAALAVLILIPTLAWGAPADPRGERQRGVRYILETASTRAVRAERSGCATGEQPATVAQQRKLTGWELPDAVDSCVAALTRLGRDGTLGYVRDPRNNALTTALAFDNGFVAAYLKREPIKPTLPGMSTLRPVAERCLALKESDTDLCFAAGYAIGARAANGETVTAR